MVIFQIGFFIGSLLTSLMFVVLVIQLSLYFLNTVGTSLGVIIVIVLGLNEVLGIYTRHRKLAPGAPARTFFHIARYTLIGMSATYIVMLLYTYIVFYRHF